jgi:nonsense-mediated mRNA decay protein 3
LKNCNANDPIFDKMNPEKIPDVVLVKKVYPNEGRRGRRTWKLRRLRDDEMSVGSSAMDQ